MRCEKCGFENERELVICRSCDHILDVSFLGEDITNRPPPLNDGSGPIDAADFGGDALILGDLGDEISSFVSEETGHFLQADTADLVRAVLPAPVYIDATTEALMADDAVLELVTGDVRTFTLSPFEQHVSSFLDGERPVARVVKLSGLSLSDVRIALVLLIDRKMLRLVGTATAPQAPAVDPLDAPTVDDMQLPAFSVEERNAAVLKNTNVLQESLSQIEDASPGLNPFGNQAATAIEAPTPGRPAPPSDPLDPQATLLLLDPRPTEVLPIPGASLGIPGANQRQQAPQPPRETPDPVATTPESQRPPELSADALYQLICDDIAAGKKARARMYMKLGCNTFPADGRFIALKQQLTSTTAGDGNSGKRKEVSLFETANQAEANQEYEKAVALLKEAIAINPNVPALHNRLGVILSTRLHRYDAATAALFRAVELDSDNPTFKNNLGKVLSKTGGGPQGGPKEAGSKRGLDWLKNKLGR